MVFSLDALFALAFVAIVLSLPLVLSQDAVGYLDLDGLSTLGRDYLLLKYYYNKTIVPDNFTSLVGSNLSESEPSDYNYQWSYAVYYRYPNFFNCANSTNCSFANTSASANYSNSQDTGIDYKHAVWVRP